LLAVLVVAALGGLAWLVLRPSEPSYQGRRLSEWLDRYNEAGAMDKTGPVSDAIRAMGTNSLPFLLAHIKHTESPLKRKFVNVVAKQHWVRLPFFGTDPYQATSILALHALGSNATSLCPELLKASEDTNSYWWATMSLLAIGPTAIPTLAKLCETTNETARTAALIVIARLKTDSPPWFGWNWERAPINGRPIFGLASAGSLNDVREIIQLLDDPDPAVRHASAEAIAKAGVK
jgi:hypothetical protein